MPMNFARDNWAGPGHPSMTVSKPACALCGEPMPKGEEMFNYHGFSGPCPKPTQPKDTAEQLAGLIIDADIPKRLEAENARLRQALTMWVEQGGIDADGQFQGAAAYSPVAYAASMVALGHVKPDR